MDHFNALRFGKTDRPVLQAYAARGPSGGLTDAIVFGRIGEPTPPHGPPHGQPLGAPDKPPAAQLSAHRTSQMPDVDAGGLAAGCAHKITPPDSPAGETERKTMIRIYRTFRTF